MANALRGQVSITLGEKEFVLKPEFEVLANLENEMNKSIYAIIQDLANVRTSKVSDIAKIIYIASGKTVKPNEIGKLIIAGGAHEVLAPVMKFLTEAVATDEQLKDAQKKFEEAADPANP
jgi:hypothetical protein